MQTRFYWIGIKQDCYKHCKNCIICQAIKGGVRSIAPMLERDLPAPRSHIMADFIGPLLDNYYILVFIDYGTGYVMLQGFSSNGAREVVEMILNHWTKIFGYFKTFESDFGSGFHNELMDRLSTALNVNVEFSEPYNHHGTGKVERVIQMVQQILRAFNVESGNTLTKKQYDKHYKTLQKLKYNYKKFNPGTKILYFCGDKPVPHSKKWVQRWNGPFTIVKRLNDHSVVIMDENDGASRRVSVDRIKVFENNQHYQIDEYVKLMTNRVFQK